MGKERNAKTIFIDADKKKDDFFVLLMETKK